MQESSSSHSIPHVALASESKAPPKSYSAASTADGSVHASSTPQFKKKVLAEQTASPGSSHLAKYPSFDYTKSKSDFSQIDVIDLSNSVLAYDFFFVADSPIASLVRSGSFMSAPKQTNVVKKGSIDGNGGASDDSMHEKYFKSVENTPVSKRKNQSLSAGSNQKHSSDSSPHSPMSPKKNVCMRDLFIVHWHENVRWIMLVLLSFFLS